MYQITPGKSKKYKSRSFAIRCPMLSFFNCLLLFTAAAPSYESLFTIIVEHKAGFVNPYFSPFINNRRQYVILPLFAQHLFRVYFRRHPGIFIKYPDKTGSAVKADQTGKVGYFNMRIVRNHLLRPFNPECI